MKRVYASVIIFIIGVSQVFAQKQISINLNYDKINDIYEVTVQPNFTQKSFVWGPAQISLILPTIANVRKIKVMSLNGGWCNNSTVLSPEVSPEGSYYGVSSNGMVIDFEENKNTSLFYFRLPQNVNNEMVRLFNNYLDPKPGDLGMMGSDFLNSVDAENVVLGRISKTNTDKIIKETISYNTIRTND